MSWSQEQIESILAGWAEGLTASQIGARIRKSRNAVIGKLHRLKRDGAVIPDRGKVIKVARRQPPPKPKKKPTPPTEQARIKAVLARFDGIDRQTVAGHNIALEDLQDHHCRWPSGEGRAIRFCGHDRELGLRYCAAHVRLAYEVPPRNSRTPFVLKQMVKRVLTCADG